MEQREGLSGLYTPEEASALFKQFSKRLEKELKVSAVQERVRAKIMGSKTDIFDLNFYKEPLSQGNEEALEELLSQSMSGSQYEDRATENTPEEESTEKYLNETRADSIYSGLANHSSKIVDDMAEDSCPGGEEEEEEFSSACTDFIASESSEGDDGIPQPFLHDYELQHENEIRRLKRRFGRRRMRASQKILQAQEEEPSSSSSMAELSPEVEVLTSDILGREDVHTQELVVVKEEIKKFKEESLFEENGEALSRLQNGTVRKFGFTKDSKQ